MKDDVRRYLRENYDASHEDIDTALQTDEAKTIVDKAVRDGSFAYYPGDQIAHANGWRDNGDEDAWDGTPSGDDDE